MGEWKDEINKVLDEIKGGLTSQPAPTNKKSLGIFKDVVTGGAKMAAGGIGAIPTAIGKGLEQTPAVIGKAIGAVPKTSPDLSSNPSAKLAGEGYGQFTKGIGDAATAARSGIMSALDLQEAPKSVTQPTRTTTSTTSSSVNQPAVTTAQKPAADKQKIMDEIQATRVPPAGGIDKRLGIGSKENAGYVENATTGERIYVPKSTEAMGQRETNRAATKSFKEVYDEVLGTLGDNRAGMKKVALDKAAEIYNAQLGLEGHKVTAVESSKDRLEISKERNEILRQQIEDKRTAGEDTRQQKAELKRAEGEIKREQMFRNELKAFAVKRMNLATGESDLDFTPHLFKVAMTAPDRVPDAFKSDAEASVQRFNEFVADWERHPKSGKSGGKATPEEKKGLYELYLKKLSQ